MANLSRPVADGCAAAVKSGAVWLVGGEARVQVLEPRSQAWDEEVVEMPAPVQVVGSMEAGLASLQGGAPQPWWEHEEDPLPQVEAWTRPSRTGLRRKRDAQALYQYGVQDQGGSRKDNFGKGWGQDPGLGPPETRYVELPGYPGEASRIEQAIRGGRISYPAMPKAETKNARNFQGIPGYPTDPNVKYSPFFQSNANQPMPLNADWLRIGQKCQCLTNPFEMDRIGNFGLGPQIKPIRNQSLKIKPML